MYKEEFKNYVISTLELPYPREVRTNLCLLKFLELKAEDNPDIGVFLSQNYQEALNLAKEIVKGLNDA